MLEKFTEKAINAVIEARNQAKLMKNVSVQPEHLLLALLKQAKGISLKIFKTCNIDYDSLKKIVTEKLKFEKTDKELLFPPFSLETKEILKNTLDLAQKSGNPNILYEHLLLAVINDKTSYISRILEKFNFDTNKSKDLLIKLVQKKTQRIIHPETEEQEISENNYKIENYFDGTEAKAILDRAVSKLTASNYEILGTEQIILSILEDKNSELTKILEQEGVSAENFEHKLNEQTSRQAEFEEKQIIFTPNAFISINTALELAKEYGSSEITPAHMLLGLIKSKKGLAYNILKTLNVNTESLAQKISKPIESQMPETLTILRLAKQEARRLGRNIIGSEMILLGMLAESTCLAARVLNELEISIKDVRKIVEDVLGYGDEYFDLEMIYTDRAKKLLEKAWFAAKKEHKAKIESKHLLLAITEIKDSFAMKILEQLGVDYIEIIQGIKKEAEKSD